VIPWAIWTLLIGLISLTLYVAIRGRWGREAPALLVAAVLGAAAGNFIAALLGVDLLVLGEYHVIGAAIGALLALTTTGAIATLLARPAGRRDGAGSGR
jgi:hypothetical protein